MRRNELSEECLCYSADANEFCPSLVEEFGEEPNTAHQVDMVLECLKPHCVRDTGTTSEGVTNDCFCRRSVLRETGKVDVLPEVSTPTIETLELNCVALRMRPEHIASHAGSTQRTISNNTLSPGTLAQKDVSVMDNCAVVADGVDAPFRCQVPVNGASLVSSGITFETAQLDVKTHSTILPSVFRAGAFTSDCREATTEPFKFAPGSASDARPPRAKPSTHTSRVPNERALRKEIEHLLATARLLKVKDILEVLQTKFDDLPEQTTKSLLNDMVLERMSRR